MKKFEHEVLDFDLTKKDQHAVMAKALAEWGAAGFEVVSVVPHGQLGGRVTIFLKHELPDGTKSEAA
jgi:hypothetical protein